MKVARITTLAVVHPMRCGRGRALRIDRPPTMTQVNHATDGCVQPLMPGASPSISTIGITGAGGEQR